MTVGKQNEGFCYLKEQWLVDVLRWKNMYGGGYLNWVKDERIVNEFFLELINIGRVAATALRILFSFPRLSKNLV